MVGFSGGFLHLNAYICQVLQAQLARALDWQSRGRRFESALSLKATLIKI